MKRILLYGSGTVVCVLAMLWMSANIIPLMPAVIHFINTQSQLFLIIRWMLIGVIFFVWPKVINRCNWSIEKKRYWLSRRFSLTLWLVIFELLLCENGILLLGHWL